MMKQNLNKKSLKKPNKKGLSKKQNINDDFIASDILARLQVGVSELEIFASLMEQAVPMDEIQNAFAKVGYDQNKFGSLIESFEKAMQSNKTPQVPDYAAPPQMQFGGGNAFFI